MAKRQGLWAELQRERARREGIRLREFRESQHGQARAAREAVILDCNAVAADL